MRADTLLIIAIPVVFATSVTTHVALAAGLAARGSQLRALVAFLVLPLAPLWGARAGMRVRAGLWVAAVVAYGALRIAARR